MPKRYPGKFWPKVRAMIWEKAHELFQKEQALTMADDFKGPKRLMQVSLDGYL